MRYLHNSRRNGDVVSLQISTSPLLIRLGVSDSNTPLLRPRIQWFCRTTFDIYHPSTYISAPTHIPLSCWTVELYPLIGFVGPAISNRLNPECNRKRPSLATPSWISSGEDNKALSISIPIPNPLMNRATILGQIGQFFGPTSVEIAWSINLWPTATEPPRLLYFALYTDRGKPFSLSHNGPKTTHPAPPQHNCTTEPHQRPQHHKTSPTKGRRAVASGNVSLEKKI